MFSMSDRSENHRYRHSALISLPMYAVYANLTSVKNASFERISLKLKDDATRQQETELFNDIKKTLGNELASNIQFYSKFADSTAEIDQTVSLLFDVVIVITLFLCFFSLSSAMSANLYEQAKEIGVMRAIGLTKGRIIMIYVYEAFIMIFASSILGIIIGVAIGWSMTL